MMNTMDRVNAFDHDIPSLSASLEAFDPERSTHSAYSNGSRMQSSSRWSAQEAEESETESDGPWAPPAWQKSNNTWYRKSLLSESAALRSSPSKSAVTSPYQTDRDVTPSHIPLPESPYKQTPRTSPEPMSEQEQRMFTPDGIASRMQSPSEEPQVGAGAAEHTDDMALSLHDDKSGNMDGFVRFAVRGETLFRTAPIEETISSVASGIRMFTKSRFNLMVSLLTLIISWALIQPWNVGLIPDVANAAAMAKQFEPLIYASENVIPRSRELAEASIAVQDLAESVRASNMSASTIIIDQLDSLGDSVKVVAEKLPSFFTHVDGDMDSILITMEWVKREMESIQGQGKIGLLDTVIGNVQGAMNKVGLLERNGQPTQIGRIVTDVVGQTTQQRSRATLQRTFDYLLSTLEENIANELARADTLFQLFESIDRQFQNLHRSVAKEEDSLSMQKEEFLASMWRKSLGNKLKLKKYEKNLKLLKTIRANTLMNKSELKGHIQVINSVKDQLDKTRRNLVSPLIRRAQSSGFGIEQQLQDLTGTYGFLKVLRENQKHKVLQQLWGENKKRVSITAHGGEDEEEGVAE